VMPEICHSFVSRYAAIASAARNERERPVLLASFWSLLLVERSTRTENVSVFICVHCITRTEMCHEAATQLRDRPAAAGRSMGVFTASVQRENLKAGAALSCSFVILRTAWSG
jgi:hypothetical protein